MRNSRGSLGKAKQARATDFLKNLQHKNTDAAEGSTRTRTFSEKWFYLRNRHNSLSRIIALRMTDSNMVFIRLRTNVFEYNVSENHKVLDSWIQVLEVLEAYRAAGSTA